MLKKFIYNDICIITSSIQSKYRVFHIKKNILLLKTYLTNIGNGFIDNGAKILLTKSFPDYNIIDISGYQGYLAYEKALGGNLSYLLKIAITHNINSNNISKFNFVNLLEMIDADFIFFAGCVLDQSNLDPQIELLLSCKKQGKEIIFIGAGSGNYEDKTISHAKKILKKIKPKAIITRDEIAYKNYKNLSDISYNGIDCGFFINEWYDPPKSNTNFNVFSFDKQNEPKDIELEKENSNYIVIRPNHSPFQDPFRGFFRREVIYKDWLERKNIMISDDIKDYLFLYANSKETHSDRVHACVATLSYGNKARLYYKTDRALLFNKVLDENITKKLVSLNKDKIKFEKSEMQKVIKQIV